MSIAAISSSFVSAVRASVNLAPVEPVPATRAVPPGREEGGRRHELVDAMNQVLGIDGEQSHEEAQAVFRFAHALMHDLRSVDAGAEAGPGRGHGHAWGRRDWSDLPQRIDALATAAGAPVAAAPPATATAIATSGAIADTAPPPAVVVEPTLPEVPPQPNPVTSTSAAVHLMQVPSSRLLEAFAALHRVLSEQAEPLAPETDRAGLATMLRHLSDELAAGSPAELPAGSVLNVTA